MVLENLEFSEDLQDKGINISGGTIVDEILDFDIDINLDIEVDPDIISSLNPYVSPLQDTVTRALCSLDQQSGECTLGVVVINTDTGFGNSFLSAPSDTLAPAYGAF